MASPNQIFTELVTTTFRKHRKNITDNVSHHNALYRRIMQKRMYRLEDGGITIAQPLEYAENGTYQRFSGYDVLDIGASDVFTAAEFQWRQIALNVTASGEELRKNSGESRIINLAKSRIRNAMNTFANNFSFDLYSNGTLPNQINGLQALLPNTGQGVVGGIDASQWAFWQNQVQKTSAPIGGGAPVTLDKTNIEALMRALWLACVRGNDKPDLIVFDNGLFSIYEDSQLSMKRYVRSGKESGDADGGFDELAYKSADVIFDGNSGIPANTGYFINTDYTELVIHKDANLDILEEARPINQDASVTPILWMGNLCISNRARQGVFFNG